MDIFEKIKEFTKIMPTTMDVGAYLKDSSNVCKLYHEMIGLEALEDIEEIKKRELEIDGAIDEILKHWEK